MLALCKLWQKQGRLCQVLWGGLVISYYNSYYKYVLIWHPMRLEIVTTAFYFYANKRATRSCRKTATARKDAQKTCRRKCNRGCLELLLRSIIRAQASQDGELYFKFVILTVACCILQYAINQRLMQSVFPPWPQKKAQSPMSMTAFSIWYTGSNIWNKLSQWLPMTCRWQCAMWKPR